jgi:alkanesulfonate monooxygenase SsuD/methylene tetrahydromethanopterin reductase-like flavin-dependent oxidoreductase (luciferase family)
MSEAGAARTAMRPAPKADPKALRILEETIQVLRLLWQGKPSTQFEGEFYRLTDSAAVPVPAHDIDIWLGAHDPQTFTRVGRLCDGWVADSYPTVQPDELGALSRHFDDALTSAGRQPAEVQRVWYIGGEIGAQENDTPFQGTSSQWAKSLAEIAVDLGIDTFFLVEGEGLDEEEAEQQLQEFALEVVPNLRQRVEASAEEPISSGLLRAYQGAHASGPTRAEEESGALDWVDETSMESFPASDPPASNSFT